MPSIGKKSVLCSELLGGVAGVPTCLLHTELFRTFLTCLFCCEVSCEVITEGQLVVEDAYRTCLQLNAYFQLASCMTQQF